MKKYFYCKFQSKLENDVHPNENQNSLLTSCEDVTYLCFDPRKVKKKNIFCEKEHLAITPFWLDLRA